jgi:hypothetical protein
MKILNKINDIQEMVKSFGGINESNYEEIWTKTTEIIGDDGDSFEPSEDYITVIFPDRDKSELWYVDIYPDRIMIDLHKEVL